MMSTPPRNIPVDQPGEIIAPAHNPACLGGRPSQEEAVPTEDYFYGLDLDSQGDLEELVERLECDLQNKYFLRWEAVERYERGQELTTSQQAELESLVYFGDDEIEEEPILYINESARPSRPWYEIVRLVASKLPLDQLTTWETHYEVTTEGWPRLFDAVNEYGKDLSLPPGVNSPTEVVPKDVQHRLWFQYCCDAFVGIGQDSIAGLSDEESHFRLNMFVERLKECKESVEYLGLNLEKIKSVLILPPDERQAFEALLMKKLGLSSVSEPIIEHLD